MTQRAARVGLLLALALALFVAALAGRRLLSRREETPAAVSPEPAPPGPEVTTETPGKTKPEAELSDRERILAWAARTSSDVSFDAVGEILEWNEDLAAWYDSPRGMLRGDVVAVRIHGKDKDAALAELPDGVTIPVVILVYGSLSARGAACLSRIRGLRRLEASWCGLTDDSFGPVTELTELEYLDLSGNSVTDASLGQLGRLTALRELLLIGTDVTGTTGASAHLPASLEALCADCNHELGDAFVTALPPLPNLRVLGLDSTRVTDESLASIGAMRDLRRLGLRFVHIGGAGVPHLRNLRELESLDIAGAGVSDECFATLSGLSALVELDLNGTGVATLAGVEALPRLHTLQLGSTSVGDEALARLAGLHDLDTLGLVHTRVTDRGLVHLGSLQRLRDLRLSGNDIQGTGLAYLRGLTALETLSLSSTRVDDAGIQQLGGLPALQEMDLFGTRVTVEGLLTLKSLPSLKKVVIGVLPRGDAARLASEFAGYEFQEVDK